MADEEYDDEEDFDDEEYADIEPGAGEASVDEATGDVRTQRERLATWEEQLLSYLGMVKVASWRRHSWPPRALPAASEGLGLLSALVRRDRTSQMSPGGRGHGATPRPSNRFRRV